MLILDERSDGDTVRVRVNQELEVRLQENPTAGFRWRVVQTGSPVCTLLGHGFDPGADAPGQTGNHSWKFRVTSAGTAIIKLVYCRTWEDADAGARSFALTLNVEA